MAEPAEDLLAKERDEKFKIWLLNKTLGDKALDYLKQLHPRRAENAESLKEVGVCLQAVDRLMGTVAGSADDDDDIENSNNNKKVRNFCISHS